MNTRLTNTPALAADQVPTNTWSPQTLAFFIFSLSLAILSLCIHEYIQTIIFLLIFLSAD